MAYAYSTVIALGDRVEDALPGVSTGGAHNRVMVGRSRVLHAVAGRSLTIPDTSHVEDGFQEGGVCGVRNSETLIELYIGIEFDWRTRRRVWGDADG